MPSGIYPRERKSHCPQDHEYTTENTRINSKGTRRCRTCQQELDRKYYATNVEKCRESRREYRASNPEKIRERNRKYRAANREKVQEKKREYYAANTEKVRATVRKHYAAHSDKIREKNRQYYEQNVEEIRERRRKHREENPKKYAEIDRAHRRKREALKKSQIGLWDEDWFIERQLWLYQDGKCAYCQTNISYPTQPERTFHLEHCTPLSRQGKHCATNVVLSCVPCNLKKGTKTAEEFAA